VNEREHNLGPVGTDRLAQQRLTEPDREAEDLKSEASRDPEMAELVHDDQEANRDDVPEDVPETVKDDVHILQSLPAPPWCGHASDHELPRLDRERQKNPCNSRKYSF
jgi:hypothetical protein